MDENDNFPVFLKPYDFISIQWAPNQTVYNLSATDADQNWNGQIYYRLTEDTDLFVIEGSILRSTSIDPGEETQLIEIEAYDGGIPPKSSTMILQISPTSDDFESGPKIANTYFSVETCYQQQQVVGKLEVKNLKSKSTELEFKFVEKNSRFEIDKKSGWIWTKNLLKYSSYESIAVRVIVRIKENEEIQLREEIKINLSYCKKIAPEIKTSSLSVQIHYQSERSFVVGKIEYSKEPISTRLEILWVENVRYSTNSFWIANGNLLMGKRFDGENRKLESTRKVLLRACLWESLTVCSLRNITVSISDQRLGASFIHPSVIPVEKGRNKFTLKSFDGEGRNSGKKIDLDSFSKRYSLSSFGRFSFTGELKNTEEVFLSVGSSPAKLTLIPVGEKVAGNCQIVPEMITIFTDSEDVPFAEINTNLTTLFLANFRNFDSDSPQQPFLKVKNRRIFPEMSENVKPGTFLLSLRRDRRCPGARYSTATDIIEIDANLGHVSLRQRLDFETQKQFRLSLFYRCGEFSASSVLEIEVVDINDEAPAFITAENFIFIVQEDYRGVIGRVEAFDRDSEFQFTVPENDFIMIEKSTGIISTNKGAKFSSKMGLFGFKCYLDDGGSKSERIFFLKITPTAANSSKFSTTKISNFKDSSLLGIHSISGRRHFIKSSSPARLSSFLEYTPLFGILRRKDSPIFQTSLTGNITLAAIDEKTETITEKVLSISLIDEQSPRLIPPPPPRLSKQAPKKDEISEQLYREFNVSESVEVGEMIASLSFTEGSHFENINSEVFSINSIGEIIVRKRLDCETTKTIPADFSERNLKYPSWSRTIKVTFNILDVNDEAPYISNAPESISISASQVGQIIAVLDLKDDDTPDPFFLSSIFSTPFDLSDCFSINNFGELTLLKYPEDITTGEIRVVASDNAKETITPIRINVEKKLSKFSGFTARSCETPEYSEKVAENAKIGDKILNLRKKFRIIHENDSDRAYFRVSRGLLFLKKELDFEKIETIFILLEMTREKCQAVLTILVEDINDEAPRFLTKFVFNATKEIGKFIGKIRAYDADKNDILSYSSDNQFVKVNEVGEIELKKVPKEDSIVISVAASDGLHKTQTDVIISFKDSAEKMAELITSWTGLNETDLYTFTSASDLFTDHDHGCPLFYIKSNVLKFNDNYERTPGTFNLSIINTETSENSTLSLTLCKRGDPIISYKLSFSSTPVKLYSFGSCSSSSWIASLPEFLELNGENLFLNISDQIQFQKSIGKEISVDFACLVSSTIRTIKFEITAGYFPKMDFEKERYVFQGTTGRVNLLPTKFQSYFSTKSDSIEINKDGSINLKTYGNASKISVRIDAVSFTYPTVTASTIVTFNKISEPRKIIECFDFCPADDRVILKADSKLERNKTGQIVPKKASSSEALIIEKGLYGDGKSSILAIGISSQSAVNLKPSEQKLVLTRDSKFIELADGTVRLIDPSIQTTIEAFIFENKEPIIIDSILLLPSCGSTCSQREEETFELKCKTTDLDIISSDNCSIKKPERSKSLKYPLELLGGAVGISYDYKRIRRVDYEIDMYDDVERVIFSSFSSDGKFRIAISLDKCGFKIYQNTGAQFKSSGCESMKLKNFAISFNDRISIQSGGKTVLKGPPEQPFQMIFGGGVYGPINIGGKLIQPFFGKINNLEIFPENSIDFVDIDDVLRSINSDISNTEECKNDLSFERFFCSKSSDKNFSSAGFLGKPMEKKSNSLATLPQPMTPMANQQITQETPIMNDASSNANLSVSNRHEYLSAVSFNSLRRPPNIITSPGDMERELVL
ncbi:Oidioi.mRNA.OKI2018_I69.PAR.g10254.t1.cds [Oikopleura dioica]|uniref:Oidioi.mRNA.OKI2018_I69.PAR.g10254.t1.cds n=1 Tax=Oikopleura dioica TaxID=34765 RepID=A0ABN7RQR6_OIKDI|nr:Oidioi.mRNA.OKI2018_I69.PAR.g10254.t1.cds [Oikopleura dioica]